MQPQFHGGFCDVKVAGNLSRRPGRIVRADYHSTILGRQAGQRVTDQLPICHKIRHLDGAFIPLAAQMIDTTLAISGAATHFRNCMVLVSHQELSCVNI